MIEVTDLAAMGRADLARLWSELIGGEMPASISQPMQRRFLAFGMQVRAERGMPVDLSIARLIRDGIPMDWKEQARIVGVV